MRYLSDEMIGRSGSAAFEQLAMPGIRFIHLSHNNFICNCFGCVEIKREKPVEQPLQITAFWVHNQRFAVNTQSASTTKIEK
jgi:hypothetical protein